MINSNPIEINKSSLVSLKAEILRKQQEINVSRLSGAAEASKPVIKSKKKNVPKLEKTNKIDNVEEDQLLAKSRQMLESKANLYDSLSARASNPTEEDKEITKRILVQFDRKEPAYNSDDDYHSDDYDQPVDPDEEWIEYTDVLGRTRKCLRKDLDYMKKKDRDFAGSVDIHREETVNNFVKDSGHENEEKVENAGDNLTDENELLSSDMRRELLRREWEKQEEDLLKKNDIHYQDVLFNEARFHGAGYYSFSRDEEERAKQQQNLNKLRQETTKLQQTTAEMKKIREKQMAARLKAARNRKRARMGLPPEPEESEDNNEEIKPNPEEEIKKRIDAAKELEEKQKQIERSKIVRPWDIGKEILKTHHEHSQEEWVDKQRDQRPQEFAPPSFYSGFNPKRPILEISEPENKKLFFTSKKAKHIDSSSTVTSNSYTESSPSMDPNSIEESVLAGLRFLREQSEKRKAENE